MASKWTGHKFSFYRSIWNSSLNHNTTRYNLSLNLKNRVTFGPNAIFLSVLADVAASITGMNFKFSDKLRDLKWTYSFQECSSCLSPRPNKLHGPSLYYTCFTTCCTSSSVMLVLDVITNFTLLECPVPFNFGDSLVTVFTCSRLQDSNTSP